MYTYIQATVAHWQAEEEEECKSLTNGIVAT